MNRNTDVNKKRLMIHFVLFSISPKWILIVPTLWISLFQTPITQYFQCENSLLVHSTYRLPVHCFRQLPIWVKSSMNIGRIPPIKPNGMTIWQLEYYRHIPMYCLPHHNSVITCAGNLVPCLRVCNTASQTPALQAGDLASPSPFLW